MALFRRKAAPSLPEADAAPARPVRRAVEARLDPADLRARVLRTAPSIADHLLGTWKTAARLALRTAHDGDIPLGASKLGGAPDVSASFAWPTWQDPRGGSRRPLCFFAQVDLASLAGVDLGFPLPSSGLLAAFADFHEDGTGITGLRREEHRGALLVHVPANERLVRAAAPAGASTLPSAELAPVLVTSLAKDAPSDVHFPDDEFDALDELYAELVDHAVPGLPDGFVLSGAHQVGGHPDHIQHPVEEEALQASAACWSNDGFDRARWAKVASQVGQWRTILQIDSEDALDVMWGDVGTLWWSLPLEDLRAERFDQAWFTFQCS